MPCRESNDQGKAACPVAQYENHDADNLLYRTLTMNVATALAESFRTLARAESAKKESKCWRPASMRNEARTK
jgi:hypothetical protein